MSTILIHAGTPKAGSSSIQRWLERSSAELRERGFTLLVTPRTEAREARLAPHRRGGCNSGWVVGGLIRSAPEAQAEWAETFARQLAACAQEHGDVILSGETFALLFCQPYEAALTSLQRLTDRFEVRIAYYARPQHTTLEATWRQWGFYSPMTPSAWIEMRAARLHYAATLEGVRKLAPDLRFGLRPFRLDLLDSGDVVVDFARSFLGIEVEPGGEWANRTLPLEVANALASAPKGMFWDRGYGNKRVERIKELLADHSFPEEDRIALSRQVLRKYAHERFAAENAELGWEDFVPPPHDPEGTPGLEALDDLWRPQASPAELAFLHRVLESAVAR